MRLMTFALAGGLAGVMSLLLTPAVRWSAVRLGAVDQPGSRKVHLQPVPRLGGLAIMASTALVFVLFRPIFGFAVSADLWTGLGLGLLPILTVSIIDDIRRVGAGVKVCAQLAGALVAVWFGITLQPEVHLFGFTIAIGAWSIPISVLWLVGVTNAFNLVDGLDGLSAGLALISVGSLVPVFVIAGQPAVAGAALVLFGAVIGFLPYNFYPASIFLGDGGATGIGFCLACLALKGGSTLSAGFAVLLPVIALGLPIAETALSMVRRALGLLDQSRSGGVFEADQRHIHHRLLDLGFGHRRAVLLLYLVSLTIAGVGLLSILTTNVQAGWLLAGLLLAGFAGIGRLGYQELAVIRSGVVLRFYDAPMLKRSLFVTFLDLVFVAVVVWITFGLKHDDWLLRAAGNATSALMMAFTLGPAVIAVFWAMGLYREEYRQAGIREIVRITGAVGLAAAGSFVVLSLWADAGIPLSTFLICALLEAAVSGGARLSYRVLVTTQWRAARDGQPALIYGAGLGGVTALREMLANAAVDLRPVGFIDDNPRRVGQSVNGVRVLGTLEDLSRCLDEVRARAVVVASKKITWERIEHARRVCDRAGVALLRMDLRFDAVAVADTRSPDICCPGRLDLAIPACPGPVPTRGGPTGSLAAPQ